ncbi:PAS-domain containing protein [Acidimangrovimonas sediminis]|uniref:PAS-domain containing protein n=1 Tax=Acidimangrovimonas sediminis TaxID=2056283 RepID=UPI001E4FE748|nr:PAS-domain containing protein [Acidimangrovimonas sediminis]
MIDATGPARALLNAGEGEDNWSRLLSYLLPRFPGIEDHIADLSERGRVTLMSQGPRPLTLKAEWRGGLTRLSLHDPRAAGSGPGATLDPISQRALEDELSDLRGTVEEAPFLVWREAPDRAVIWANRRYLDLARKDDEEDIGWPLPQLFPDLDLAEHGQAPGATRRASVRTPKEGTTLWFDCRAMPAEAGRLVFALPADAAVQAESSLRSFVQTLTKTFAHLTIGLAIFDRQRRLVLFNPALIELTQISPEFLSARPTLPDFLDAMRDRRTIPEPKDYKTWRDQLAALEKAAASGQYEETWTLPSGLTYRVTGRPHPDGAVAFLFEDISAEMSLTRRFRAELELSQAVIDAMEEAIAVFSPAGQLIVSNAACDGIWGCGAAETPISADLSGMLARWRQLCAPSPVWDRLADFIRRVGPRDPWSGELRLTDGRALTCHCAPVTGGATLVRFVARAAEPTALAAPAATPPKAGAASPRKRRA